MSRSKNKSGSKRTKKMEHPKSAKSENEAIPPSRASSRASVEITGNTQNSLTKHSESKKRRKKVWKLQIKELSEKRLEEMLNDVLKVSEDDRKQEEMNKMAFGSGLVDDEFDETQWEHTEWHDDYKKGLLGPNNTGLDVKFPYAAEVPGESLQKKAEKGAILIKTPYKSVAVDIIELAAALTAVIILLFTLKFHDFIVFYPLCNTIISFLLVVVLLVAHTRFIYVQESMDEQGNPHYFIKPSVKFLFLHTHVIRIVFSIISAIQCIYFATYSMHTIMFILSTLLILLQGACASFHLFYVTRNRFALQAS